MDDQLRMELEKYVTTDGTYNTDLSDKALAILAINKLMEFV